MSLEAVIYQQDPLTNIYGCKDYDYNNISTGFSDIISGGHNLIGYWESPEETSSGGAGGRRKRRRSKLKDKEEMEKKRMIHIAVERNRRRQMNDYLALLRSLMPPSYAQRGDQASIVGGAINFVKELEQLLQFLEGNKFTHQQKETVFSNFLRFPQYSMKAAADVMADIEVSMVEAHANIKIVSKRRPKQLLKMVAGFHSIQLNILHLNVTTVDHSVLFSFNVKVEDECELNTVNEIATAVHEMLVRIQQESTS